MDVGIIGGADGPTSIFITSSYSWCNIAIIAIVCIAVVGLIVSLIRKKRVKH